MHSAALFTFDTTHHALWAEEVAAESGIPAQVVPAPPAARARCNLALETFPEDEATLAAVLAAAGVPFSRYAVSPEA
jgi:hypothetical protein